MVSFDVLDQGSQGDTLVGRTQITLAELATNEGSDADHLNPRWYPIFRPAPGSAGFGASSQTDPLAFHDPRAPRIRFAIGE